MDVDDEQVADGERLAAEREAVRGASWEPDDVLAAEVTRGTALLTELGASWESGDVPTSPDDEDRLPAELEAERLAREEGVSWESDDVQIRPDDEVRRQFEAELRAAPQGAAWESDEPPTLGEEQLLLDAELRAEAERLAAEGSWSSQPPLREDPPENAPRHDVEGLVVRASRNLAVPRDSVLASGSTGRRRPPRPSVLQLGLVASTIAVITACTGVLWALRGGWVVPWWPAVLAALLGGVFCLRTVGARQGSGRGGQLLYRPVNGLLVAAAGTLPPLALLAFLALPGGGSRRVEDVTNRLVRLVALTAGAAVFHAADLGSGESVSNVQALWLLAAPVAFWATESAALAVVQRVAAGSTPSDLGMWRPSVVARELGEAATGLVLVVAGLVNPILCLIGVPLVAASTAAVVELARSRTADLDRKTGLLNEPAFTYLATRELERAARTSTQVSLLMLDLDHLKRLNDTHGHLAGDVAIVGIADQIAARMRSTDLACRFGGEEFTVLLPDTGLPGALALAERIRLAVEAFPVAGRDGSHVPISVSIGVASWAPGTALAELKQSADDALYDAKHSGRNRVMAAAVDRG